MTPESARTLLQLHVKHTIVTGDSPSVGCVEPLLVLVDAVAAAMADESEVASRGVLNALLVNDFVYRRLKTSTSATPTLLSQMADQDETARLWKVNRTIHELVKDRVSIFQVYLARQTSF